MTVGEKIKTLRKSLGLTQTELGQRVGVQKNAVSKWECGRVEDIPTSTIKLLANLFGVPASYLIDDDTYNGASSERSVAQSDEISQRILSLIETKELSYGVLSEKTGIPKSVLQRYATGQTEKIPIDRLEAIAKALGTSTSYLIGWEDQPPIPASPNIHPLPAMKQWKVLGGTACGQPLFKPLEDASVLAPADIDADFVFQCVGDSMINARIFDGDTVFVKEGDVPDGQIGVVRVGEEYTLKRIYHGTDYLELRSENPMYLPIIIRGEQENAEIVGRAVQFLSRVI